MRRSVSSWVSPGPSVPMPPPWRSKCAQRRVRRGIRYWSWAISTWSLASRVRACRAKMSRIRPERSRIMRPVSSSRRLAWPGERSSSKMIFWTFSRSHSSVSSRTFPPPRRVAGSKFWRCCTSSPATCAPAESARRASSARCWAVVLGSCSRVLTPTSHHALHVRCRNVPRAASVWAMATPTRWSPGACACSRTGPLPRPAPAIALGQVGQLVGGRGFPEARRHGLAADDGPQHHHLASTGQDGQQGDGHLPDGLVEPVPA
jgi:hypothetical protein